MTDFRTALSDLTEKTARKSTSRAYFDFQREGKESEVSSQFSSNNGRKKTKITNRKTNKL